MAERFGEDNQIKFAFEYDADYRIVAANGAWGGISPRGDVRLDFFVESIANPQSVVNLITPDGNLGNELSREPATHLVRRLQMGVLLSLEQAEVTADFIKKMIAEFRTHQSGQGGQETRS